MKIMLLNTSEISFDKVEISVLYFCMTSSIFGISISLHFFICKNILKYNKLLF